MFYDLPGDNLNLYMQNGILISSILTFISLFFIPAHYGKFYDEKKSLFAVSNRIGWFIEEVPNVLITLYYLFNYMNNDKVNYINILMISFFFVHYLHRTFIFPFKIANTKKMPFEILIMGCLFCTINALMQTRSVFLFCNYSWETLNIPMFFIGLCLFFLGMYINIYHDYLMISMKKNSNGYIIPHGFLFTYISCPNYLGEIIEWIGFAMITQTFSGLTFPIFTFSNLFPRAIQSHKWYKSKFENYPKNRKAIIPYVI